jgi:hypothetical protein
LLDLIAAFFNAFIGIEQKYNPRVQYFIEDGKLSRRLDFKRIDSIEQLAKCLTDYVANIDSLLNLFISNYASGVADRIVEANYLTILSDVIF